MLMICKVSFIDKCNKVINKYIKKKVVASGGEHHGHAVVPCGMLFLQYCWFLK